MKEFIKQYGGFIIGFLFIPIFNIVKIIFKNIHKYAINKKIRTRSNNKKYWKYCKIYMWPFFYKIKQQCANREKTNIIQKCKTFFVGI